MKHNDSYRTNARKRALMSVRTLCPCVPTHGLPYDYYQTLVGVLNQTMGICKKAVLLATMLISTFCPCLLAEPTEPTERATYVRDRELTSEERGALFPLVPMIKLIANPHQYNNKIITVQGFLHVQFEDQKLYLCKDFGDHLMWENALYVSFASSNLLLQPVSRTTKLPKERERALDYFDRKYVLLIGKFHEEKLDPNQLTELGPNRLTDVSRVLELLNGNPGR